MNIKQKRLAALLLAVVLTPLAACSVSSSGTPSDTPATTAPQPTPSYTSIDPPSDPGGSSDPGDTTRLERKSNGSQGSGNTATEVDYAATSVYLEATIKHTDLVWSNWFKAKGLEEPWVTYIILMPGQTFASKCYAEPTTSNFDNAYYCMNDMNDHDRGVIVLPVETFAKMWTGNIFSRQVNDVSKTGDFAAGVITAHEFGHHIQDELSEDYGIAAPPNPQIELIADCFAGVWAYALNEDGMLESGDIDEALNALYVIGDQNNSHGTPEQRDAAFQIGAYGTTADPRGGVPENCIATYWPAAAGH